MKLYLHFKHIILKRQQSDWKIDQKIKSLHILPYNNKTSYLEAHTLNLNIL